MFNSGHWAMAFVNSLTAQGGDTQEGLNALVALAAWVKSLPGAVFGSFAAEQVEKLIRDAAGKTRDSSENINSAPAVETAMRLIVLLVKKNALRHIDSVIGETKKILDRKNGIVQVLLEFADTADSAETVVSEESRIREAIRKKTGAARVDIIKQKNPELIGGYRLRIGDEIVDASIRSQLRRLETCLAAGVFDPTGGGN